MLHNAASLTATVRGTAPSSRRILTLTLPQAVHLSSTRLRLFSASPHHERAKPPSSSSRSRPPRHEKFGFDASDYKARRMAQKGSSSSSSSPLIWKPSASVDELHARKNSPPDYSLPAPASDQVVAARMDEALAKLGREEIVARRVKALGLTEEAAALLLARRGEGQVEEEHTSIARLLRSWTKERRNQLAEERRNLRSSSVDSTPLPLLSTARSIIDGLPKAALDQDANALSSALLRSQAVAFLDWVQAEFVTIAANKSSNSSSSSSSPAVIAATAHHSLEITRSLLNARNPADLYPEARSLKRRIHLHVGPTNSGKTHGALLRLVRAHTGIYLGPLRLLAHEVWDRINTGKVAPGVSPRPCNLKTGEEEQSMGPLVGLQSSTVEMVDQKQRVDVAVIDEIQMIADPQRGHAWTTALLSVAAREVHLCGEPSAVGLVEKLVADCGDELIVHEYERLTPLEVAEHSLEGDLSRLRPGDCLVGFARTAVFMLKSRIDGIPLPAPTPITSNSDGDATTATPSVVAPTELRCALAYGSLPPELRAEQARMFNDGIDANVMVATDAVGMGLNLRVKRVIFETVYKFNGKETVPLSASQIKQIAGRAGRYGMGLNGKAENDDGGQALTLQPGDMDVVRAALASPRVDLTRAAVQPPPENVEALMALLPADDDFHLREAVDDMLQEEAQAGDDRQSGREKTISRALDQVEEVLREADERDARGSGKALHASGLEEAQARLRAAALGKVHSVYADLALFAAIDDSKYFLSNFDQAGHSRAVALRASTVPVPKGKGKNGGGSRATTSLLTVGELNCFSVAPLDVRNATVVAAFALFAREYSRGNVVVFDRIAEQLGLLQSLQLVEEEEDAMRVRWEKEQYSNHQDGVVVSEGDADASRLDPPIRDLATHCPPFTPIRDDIIKHLESLHASLGIYLWLSFRFPLAFSDRSSVAGVRRRVERAMELSLEAMRVAREKRLQLLGVRGGGEGEGMGASERRRREKREGRGVGGRRGVSRREDDGGVVDAMFSSFGGSSMDGTPQWGAERRDGMKGGKRRHSGERRGDQWSR